MDQQQFRALILGASGAVGRELVKELINSSKWIEVAVIARRKLEQWDQLPNKEKLRVIQVDNLDSLEQTDQWTQFKNYNTLFCVLGSRVSEGDAQFIKVDLTYPTWGGKIALLNNIPHYSLLTSSSSNRTSMFLYLRVKGLVEEALQQQNHRYLTINKPGAILNRDNDYRFGETILKYIPCVDKIECRDLAKAIRVDAERINQKQNVVQPYVQVNNNNMLLQLLR